MIPLVVESICGEASPFSSVAASQRIRVLAECLAELGEADRELLLRHYADGDTLSEIARDRGADAAADAGAASARAGQDEAAAGSAQGEDSEESVTVIEVAAGLACILAVAGQAANVVLHLRIQNAILRSEQATRDWVDEHPIRRQAG